MDRYMMISQDCHAGAPWYIYRKYLDPKYRDDYDQWVTKYVGTNVVTSEMEKQLPHQFLTMPEARQRQYLEAMEKDMGHLGNWDPVVRAKELDREGIAGEVIFHDGSQKNFPPFDLGFALRGKLPISSPELRQAGCKAHNRWLAEFCQSNKGRHAGIAMVTMDDIEETVAEIRWARQNGLFGGILLPGLQLRTEAPEAFWHHPRYEPVWQICEDLQMPVNTHATNPGVTYGDLPGSRLISMGEAAWSTYRPFWFLLWGGVFERHPKLQFCPTESGGMQVLWFNAYFDEYIAKYRRPEEVKKAISMKPSDYWRRQCYVGASAHSTRAEIEARYSIGVNNIMWGSDYPHPEGTWPVSMERTKELFSGVPEQEVRQMLGLNAARVYGFDLDQMNRIAERIGPKVADFAGNKSASA